MTSTFEENFALQLEEQVWVQNELCDIIHAQEEIDFLKLMMSKLLRGGKEREAQGHQLFRTKEDKGGR